jgi:hypothetical protein
MKSITMTNGVRTIVDDDMHEMYGKYNWTQHTKGFACRSMKMEGKWKTVFLHRLVMNVPQGKEVDHINGDRLDNKKSNLRICSREDNAKNRMKRYDSQQPFKGIRLRKGRWEVNLQCDKKAYYLGRYNTAIEAAKVYDKYAKKYFGQFARFNLNETG